MNRLQLFALSEMIEEEQEIKRELEDSRMRYVLAGVNPSLYKAVFEQSEEDGGVEWTTPQTPEEVDELLTLMNEQFVGQEAP